MKQQRVILEQGMPCGKRYVLEAATLAAILDRLPQAFLLLDWSSARIDHANAAARQLFGAELHGLIGRHVGSCFAPLSSNLTERPPAFSSVSWIIGRAQRSDGTSFDAAMLVEELPSEAGRLVTIEARRTGRPEDDESDFGPLINAAGIAGMSALMSGLAHELNQPLTAVANYVQTSAVLLAEVLGDFPAVAKAMQEAASEALRAARIMRTIRENIASQGMPRTRVSIQSLISKVRRLALCSAGVGQPDIALMCRPDIPDIVADRHQLQLALVMLLRMAAGLTTTDAPIVVRTDLVLGRLTIAISWTGLHAEAGPATTYQRLFAGNLDASRLTLSICRSIIVAHGGELRARQEGERSTLSASIAIGQGNVTNALQIRPCDR